MKTIINKIWRGRVPVIALFFLVSPLFLSGAVGSTTGGAAGSTGGGYGSFFNSFLIIVREGFEAILVISALVAYLARSGNKKKAKTVYMGAVWALLASVITAFILSQVVSVGEEGMELLEGVTMLVATAVLFYVSYWLITKSEVSRWQGYIKSKVDKSISRGSTIALGFASFMAVYREGAETSLFYLALFSTSGGAVGPIIAGFIVGAGVLVAIFLLFKYGEMRLPIGPFFAVTSALLYYLAFVFAGRGLHALQEARIISETYWHIIPKIPTFGLYPTVETLLLQGLLIVAMVAAVVYTFIIKPYREKPAPGRDL